MSNKQDEKEVLILVSPKTLNSAFRLYAEKKFLPEMKQELIRFIFEHDQKTATLKEVSNIVGTPIGGTVGSFDIENKTYKMFNDVIEVLVEETMSDPMLEVLVMQEKEE